MATIKQRVLAKNLATSLKENSKKESYGSLMVKSGYSEVTAKEPARILQGRGFQDLMAKYGITEEKLATRLNEGLDADKKDSADHSVRHKYLETALELKGLRPKNSNEINFIQEAKEWKLVIED